MSDAGTIFAPGTSGSPGTTLVDAAGVPLRSGPDNAHSDPILNAVQQQPVAATLVALIAGYILGRLV